jgi:hypothetical protein
MTRLSYPALQEALECEKEFSRGKIPPSLLSYMKRKGVSVMNYADMVQAVKDGKKAFRPTWGDGQFLWQKCGVLVHNTPYWTNESKCQALGAYPYVCEAEDALASDWIIVEDQVCFNKGQAAATC